MWVLSRAHDRTAHRIDDRPASAARFLKVLPDDYSDMLKAMDVAKKEGATGERLLDRAFEIRMGGKGA